jgi:hypothetical protein
MNESEEVPLYPLEKPIKPPLPATMGGIVRNQYDTGHVQELVDYFIEERVRIGLKDKPPTAYRAPQPIAELRKIVQDTSIAKKANDVAKFGGQQVKVLPC